MATLNRLVTVFSANTTSFTASTKKMAVSMVAFKASVMSAGKAVNSAFNRMALVAGVSAGLMIKHYADFEKRMASVGAILGKNSREMGTLTKAAKLLGRTTIFTATQAAEAQQVLAMAGLTQKEILMALGPALQLAAVGEIEIAQAAEVAAKTMRGMGLDAEQLYRVNNVLAGALVSSTTNMTQLGDALKYVAPLAAATNTSIEDTVAMIGTLSSAGFQGEMAGTGLRQAMAKLAGSTPHATKVLGDFGIQTVDASKNMLPMFDILYQMEQQALSAGQVFEIFGARAGPQMLSLLREGVVGLEEYSASLRKANEDMLAAEIEQAKLDTIWGAWRLMLSAVSGVVIDASEDIAATIREVQARFTKFFDSVESRQRVIRALSSFMRSFMGTLESLLGWLNGNSEGVMRFLSALGGLMKFIFDFMSTYPTLMAALVALKIAGLLGLTTAALSLGRALVHLALMFTSVAPAAATAAAATTAAGTAAATAGTAATAGAAGFSALAIAMAPFALLAAGVVAGQGLLKMAQMDLNKEIEEGVRLTDKLRDAQMRRFDADKTAAVEIEDVKDRLKALGEVQGDVAQAHEQSKQAIKGYETEVVRLQGRISHIRAQAEKDKTRSLTLIEMGVGAGGAQYLAFVAKKKQASADLQDEIKKEIALKKQLEAVKETLAEQRGDINPYTGERQFTAKQFAAAEGAETDKREPWQLELWLDAIVTDYAPRDYSGAAVPTKAEEPVTDVAKAIADRIKDTERTEEREKFGRPAAREGAELGEFLGLGPAKDEIQSFMNSLEGLSKAQVDNLLDARSFQIEINGDIAAADKLMREEAMAGLQAHHAEIKSLEDVKKLQEVQAKAGSLEERLFADADASQIMRAQYDGIKNALDAGTLSAQMYSEKLARVSVAYQSAGSMADQLAKVKLSEFQQQKQAQEGAKSFQTQYEDLQKAFFDGTLNTSQYRFAIKDLSEAMRASTAAAKAEAAEKKKAAAQRKRDLENVKRLTKDAYKNTTSQQPGQQIAEGPMDQLQKAHAMAMARVQLLAPTKLFGRNIAGFRLGDIRKRREEFQRAVSDVNNIQRMIEEMRMAAMRGPVMAMAANAPVFGQGVGDPGLVTQQGNVTISLPNVSRVNNEDIATLSDRLEEYHERQGSRRV